MLKKICYFIKKGLCTVHTTCHDLMHCTTLQLQANCGPGASQPSQTLKHINSSDLRNAKQVTADVQTCMLVFVCEYLCERGVY